MKISELKRIAEENDYELTKSIVHYKLTHKYCDHYISINGMCKNRLWISIPFVCDERDFNMIKAAVEFAETPLGDREEEKKCIYEHKFIKSRNGNPVYFTIRQRPNISYPVLQGSSEDVFEYKVQFTDEEIKLVLQEYEIFLDAFERIEVKDEN